LEHSLLKDEKIQSIISEELSSGNKDLKQLPDTESRWTKEGLLDIREEYGQETIADSEKIVASVITPA